MAALDLSFQLETYPAEVFSYRHHMAQWGVTKARAKQIVRKFKDERVVRSTTHQVALNAFHAPLPFGSGTWLSIKQVDKGVITNRADLAAIMRALLPAHGAFELFPAPDRLVDTSNQYHLFALPLAQVAEMVMAPLGPVERHARGFELQRLGLNHDGGAQHLVALAPAQTGDWRELYELKESCFPGCEAVFYFHETTDHALHNRLVCLDEPSFRFPFGFRQRAVVDAEQSARFGSRQRDLSSYSSPPAPGGLPELG